MRNQLVSPGPRKLARFATIGAILGLAACGGGGGGAGSINPLSPGAPSSPVSPSGSSRATFVMQWAPPTASATRRRPLYLAPTALSASLTVISAPAPWTTQTPIIEILNSPTSTLSFNAPNGLDTFLIQTYDEQNGLGNVLSRAYLTQTVSAATANIVSATLNGVISKINLNVAPALTAGTASALTVTASGLDADGNVIVGPGTYDQPIQLAIVDPSNGGTLTLSSTAIQTPGTTATLNYNGGVQLPFSITASLATGASATFAIDPIPGAACFTIPTANSGASWIAVDSSGHLWFTESTANKIGVYNGSTFTEYPIPTSNSNPQQIVAASDGNMWFTEENASKLGRITPSGGITEFATLFLSDGPFGLVDRGDGNVWYTGYVGNHIGYQGLTSGVAGETTPPTASSGPFGVATAPDNNVYFTESNSDKIGRIANLFSTISEVSLTPGAQPEGMVRGPDGNVWFAEHGLSKIGKLFPNSFSVTEFPTATPNSAPVGMVVGKDGALWFTENGLDRIGRSTTSGVMSEYGLGATGLNLIGITVKSNGAIWFVAKGTNQIGRLIY